MLSTVEMPWGFKKFYQRFRRNWRKIEENISLLWTLFVMMAKSFLQYIPRNMHTVFALLCFVVLIHWLIFPYPSGLLHWHCGNLTIAPVPAKQPWWIWINTSCEFIMNDCITTTKQSTTKPCAYFLGYTVGDGTSAGIGIIDSASRAHAEYERLKYLFNWSANDKDLFHLT